MHKLDRSYFFEFSGMPKSGKTTVIESVKHFFRRSGYPVKNFRGYDSHVAIDKSNARELNLILAARAVSYVAMYSVADCKASLHFLDRGLFDRTVFTEISRKQGEISDDEAEVLTRFLLLKQNLKHIDGLFVFVVEPNISLMREYSGTLIQAPGRVMNNDYLENFKTTLLDCYQCHKSGFNNNVLLSTDVTSPKQTGKIVAKHIWQTIGREIDEFPLL
ncbi:MAG: hypothetical protein LBQ98_07110 [Nitrososphaerota archaeon]|jgi:thymidylate kinase|nr:hypothetical protein [Nitrososphaerota archaeon]